MRTLIAKCDDGSPAYDGYECPFTGKVKPNYADALIAPDGTFYEVGSCGHDHAATQHGNVSLDRLEAEGWLHLSLEFSNYIANLSWGKAFKSTTAQINVLFTIIDDAQEKQQEWGGHFTKRHVEFLRAYVMNPDNCKD